MIPIFKYQKHRGFWQFRHCINSSIFYISRFFFQQNEKIAKDKDTRSITKKLIKDTAPSFLIAILIIVILETIEKALLNIVIIEKTLICKNSLNLLFTIYKRLNISTQSLQTLLSIVASISGILLGLYFTAISVVISSMFAKVPSNLRNLVLEEKTGKYYITTLATLTSISLILLGYISLGGHPGVLSAIFIILLGCFGIFCFVLLGYRAFLFFDPTNLSNTIFHEFNNNVRLATIKGFWWADPNYQTHYQKEASKSISTLNTLLEVCIDEPQLRKTPISIVLQKTIYFLIEYMQHRALIPSDSCWYARIPRYKSWFLHSSSVLTTAIQTQSSIQPEMVPNSYWVEDDISEMIVNSLERIQQKENGEYIYAILNTYNKYLLELGKCLEFEKGHEMIKSLDRIVGKIDKSETFNGKNIEFAIFDVYGLSFISLALGLYRLINMIDIQSIVKKIDSINWLDKKSIYGKISISLLLPTLEDVQKKLMFEKKVENTIISPKWYIRQLVVIRYIELFKEAVSILLDSLEVFFISRSKDLLSRKLFILSANHSHRGLEMCNKMRVHLPVLENLVKEMGKYLINNKSAAPEWDWEEIRESIDNAHDKLIENLAECMPFISQIEYKEDFPDIFGQCYATLCQDCYQTLIMKKANKFIHIFPLLFRGALSAHEILRKKLKDWEPESAAGITLEPLIDIMELSGYAKIYTELFNIPDIWNICKNTWDEYLKSRSNSNEVMKYLITSYSYRKNLFQIFPRDILRTNWKMKFRNMLRELDLIDEMFSAQYPNRQKRDENRHNSPLIRALCSRRHEPFNTATEVFIITYLLKRPDASGLEFKDLRNLSKAISQEEKEERNDE